MVVAVTSSECADVVSSPLCFSQRHGRLVRLSDGARTAERLHPLQEFNNGVVLTDRPLQLGRPLEFCLDRVVNKWCGSLELGITRYSADSLPLPSTMTSVGAGTVVLSGRSLLVDGKCVCRRYCRVGLDRLKVGDTVGVVCKLGGAVHFLINGEDQGVATSVSWAQIWAFVDIYGSATQVSFVESSRGVVDLPLSISSDCTRSSHACQLAPGDTDRPALTSSVTSSLCDVTSSVGNSVVNAVRCSERDNRLVFHHLHGRNVSLSEDRMVASRENADAEFNHAVLISSRPLHDNELFQVEVTKTVDRWSGSLEVGVTALSPERIQFPHTMTDMRAGTWMLSGCSVIKDGVVVNSSYGCDLDRVGVGCRVGLARLDDGSLHFYSNGIDQGVAYTHIPADVYAVCDLYGQCVEVTLLPPVRLPTSPSSPPAFTSTISCSRGNQPSADSPDQLINSWYSLKLAAESSSCFRLSSVCGTAVRVQGGGTSAAVVGSTDEGSSSPKTPVLTQLSAGTNCLLLSNSALTAGAVFELNVDHVVDCLSGCLCIGVTCLSPESLLPSEGSASGSQTSLPDHISLIDQDTWWFQDSELYSRGGKVLLPRHCSSLGRIQQNDRISLIRSEDGAAISLAVNSYRTRPCSLPLPSNIWLVVQLSDRVRAVSVVDHSRQLSTVSPTKPPTALFHSTDTSAVRERTDEKDVASLSDSVPPLSGNFHSLHGANIVLDCGGSRASRISGYNNGLVLSSQPLRADYMFQVCVERVCDENRWSGGLAAGIVWGTACGNQLNTGRSVYTAGRLPISALDVQGDIWCAIGKSVYSNGVKVSDLCIDLDRVSIGSRVAVSVDSQYKLHVYVDSVDILTDCVSVLPSNVHKLSEPQCYAIFDLYGQCIQVSVSTASNTADSQHREHIDNVDSSSEGS